MPNLTTSIPPKLTGNTNADISALKNWGTALIDELTYIFQNLDAGNVSEAGKVKAENIDTTTAKISNAQIGALTAEKITSGTINTDNVSIASTDGCLSLTGSEIVMRDSANDRFRAIYDPDTDNFSFCLYDIDGNPTVYIGSDGNAAFTGLVESSQIYASTIVGTDSNSYFDKDGGIFAEIDTKGIKINQDQNGARHQKVGLAAANNGSAYLILGEGNGSGSVTINGVKYSRGAFIAEKFSNGASLSIYGSASGINLWENGKTDINGSEVTINGRNILAEIDALRDALYSAPSENEE